MNPVQLALTDGYTILRRNLIKIWRVPDVLVFTTMSPIMFVLLFAFVFGSSIEIPGMSYQEFLIAGIFVQTVVFGSTWTGQGLATDMQKGIIDRFRTLPMSPAAVLIGRTTADIGINLISLVVMSITGLVIGWRIHSSVPEALLAYVLILAFAYALSWLMAIFGLLVRTPEVFNNASFMVVFPLTFIGNTFVDPARMSEPLRTIAEWNPVSAMTQAARVLLGNTGGLPPSSTAFPIQHPVITTVGWIAVLLTVCVPTAIWQYRRTVSR